MEKLLFNCRLADMSAMSFGVGRVANKSTRKARYTADVAEAIYNYLPAEERSKLMIAQGRKGLVFIGICESWDNSIWGWFNNARNFALAADLRKQADNMELYGTKKAPQPIIRNNDMDELPF